MGNFVSIVSSTFSTVARYPHQARLTACALCRQWHSGRGYTGGLIEKITCVLTLDNVWPKTGNFVSILSSTFSTVARYPHQARLTACALCHEQLSGGGDTGGLIEKMTCVPILNNV